MSLLASALAWLADPDSWSGPGGIPIHSERLRGLYAVWIR